MFTFVLKNPFVKPTTYSLIT